MHKLSLPLALALSIITTSTIAAENGLTGKWVGNVAGNDPHVGAVFELKQSGTKVKGTFVWISDSSGNCKRVLEGTFDPKTKICHLKDVDIISYHPNSDWRFCKIEDYELSLMQDGMQLIGKYSSNECHDNASIKLRRMDR